MFELICDQPPPPLREERAIEGRSESEYGKLTTIGQLFHINPSSK
jgi:hypothetical protein